MYILSSLKSMLVVRIRIYTCIHIIPGGKVREISREAHRRRGITRYLAQLRDNALFRACSRVAEKQRVYRRNFAVYRAMSINTFHEGN